MILAINRCCVDHARRPGVSISFIPAAFATGNCSARLVERIESEASSAANHAGKREVRRGRMAALESKVVIGFMFWHYYLIKNFIVF